MPHPFPCNEDGSLYAEFKNGMFKRSRMFVLYKVIDQTNAGFINFFLIRREADFGSIDYIKI